MRPGAVPVLHLINLNIKVAQKLVLRWHVSYKGTSFTGEDCKDLSEVDSSKLLRVSALVIMPCNPWVEDGVGKMIKLLSLVFTLVICDEF